MVGHLANGGTTTATILSAFILVLVDIISYHVLQHLHQHLGPPPRLVPDGDQVSDGVVQGMPLGVGGVAS